MLTGATGFTGSHTARALLAAGHEVQPLVRNPTKLARIFGADSALCADAVTGDVTRKDDVERALEGCDAVAHTAAVVDLRQSMAQTVLDTNRLGVEHVIGGAVQRGFESILYVSSVAAFFDPKTNGGRPLSLDGELAPTSSAYGQSKADAERYVRRLQSEGAPVRVSYPVSILGPDDPAISEGNHAITAWLGQQPLDTSSGLQFLDVRDLAELHLRLLELPNGPARFIAAGEFVAWKDFGPLLTSLTGVPVKPLRISGGVMRALGRIGDVVKRVYDFDFPLTYEAMCFATMWPGVDASGTERELGMRFRPKEDTLRDTLLWMGREGHLRPELLGRLAPEAKNS
ncbi:MAG: NAD-dependent epimerase/dehydratase family protein [Candidatus Binatia bacterium]|nr:NAD-dependent epimerase/dehydratase family protein [Candidatus Binatia bacterium]